MQETEFDQHFHPILDVPPQLLAEAAVGVDKLPDICARYGYTPEQAEQLRNDPGFKVRVSRMEQELKKEGVTFRMRAAHAAEDLVRDVWNKATSSEVGLALKIEALKTLAKLGDLEPKQNLTAQNAGAGFSITINLPKVGDQPGRTIEAKAEPVPDLGMNVPVLGTINSAIALPEDWQDE